MKAKHRVLAAGMAAAMTLSLAACGGSASTAEPTASSTVEAAAPEATSEAASGDVTEVTWWTYFGDKNIGYLQNIIDDFNNSQNQYHVTIVYQGNQMEDIIRLMIWYDWEHGCGGSVPIDTILLFDNFEKVEKLLKEWYSQKEKLRARTITRAKYLEWMLH